MDIKIQSYWNAEIKTVKGEKWSPEKVIEEKGYIVICSVVINGKFLGDVTFDGTKLGISTTLLKPREDLQP